MTQPQWDDVRVGRWLGKLDAVEAELEPVSDALFDAAHLSPGMAVLDVGCGAGSTTRRAAAAVAPGGRVTGVDIAPAMIAEAARRDPGHAIDWVVADVVDHPFGADQFDVIMSRFGVMFFSNPARAFTQLCAATRPGGRLCLAVWGALGESAAFDLPFDVVTAAFREAGIGYAEPPDVGAPSLGNRPRTEAMLESAGWRDVDFDPRSDRLYLGGPAPFEQALDAVVDFGPVRLLLEGHPAAELAVARDALRSALAPHHDGTGIAAPGGFIIVTATRR
jgi:SAM-dependent methyltransferase